MTALPPFQDVLESKAEKDSPLATTLTLLFESSPILYSDLLPGVATYIASAPSKPASYGELIDATLVVASKWDPTLKASFIAGHPRIGEVSGLSRLSKKEQAARATPPEVLARLTHLNACYEHRYPGLRYITFVNGRSRAEIKDEMEGVLGLEHSLSPDQPPVETVGSVEAGSEEWTKELERAVGDLGKIAHSRLKALGAA
ncbi:Oxo-4-hydroxy-4-carboxy-5-ureidoimidazoline decarboxylase [Rhodofomes roseus]|uniref:Oxo-4-hydroxy-4-carboxy-5-ureidoimidazoline decarboxylase n=1 Tax=Rhodofomes roseus TaxID=34475 RepID=A0ABQ8KNJ2_9APHY|nr:Oxo-4-hydroxy-4-carboxy-5-ureidoimidazoline decarboxylase [Rhodofomes roseus]KAH9839881.1 Oxo-4-hydroxy-4-carboxy-5-ureidoimidazoline decarboxylase [Rhodofomes roseus]